MSPGTVPRTPEPTDALGRVHLVGIGGAGMSGIARVLLARGSAVSGSDAKESRALRELQALGATVWVGHDAAQVAHLTAADTVVVSSAVRETNAELRAARERGLRVLLRAEALAALLEGRRAVAVAGTHGKTTTTSMLTVAAFRCGVDPSFAIGGDLNEAASNAHHGSGDLFVVEADESDGSFLVYRPDAAVVTNVEADHLDHYGDAAAVDRAFEAFVRTLRPGGFLVACADDPGSARLAALARAEGVDVRTYGLAPEADLRLTDVTVSGTTSRWVPVLDGRRLPPVRARRARPPPRAQQRRRPAHGPRPRPARGPARRGARRDSPASAAGWSSRAPPRACGSTTTTPTTRRRCTAQLLAAREVAGGGRLVVAFQPHRYSRTLAFAAELRRGPRAWPTRSSSWRSTRAGEDPVPGATGAAVAAAGPAARRAGALRAVLVGGPRGAGVSGPGPATSSLTLGRRRRHPGRARGPAPARAGRRERRGAAGRADRPVLRRLAARCGALRAGCCWPRRCSPSTGSSSAAPPAPATQAVLRPPRALAGTPLARVDVDGRARPRRGARPGRPGRVVRCLAVDACGCGSSSGGRPSASSERRACGCSTSERRRLRHRAADARRRGPAAGRATRGPHDPTTRAALAVLDELPAGLRGRLAIVRAPLPRGRLAAAARRPRGRLGRPGPRRRQGRGRRGAAAAARRRLRRDQPRRRRAARGRGRRRGQRQRRGG